MTDRLSALGPGPGRILRTLDLPGVAFASHPAAINQDPLRIPPYLLRRRDTPAPTPVPEAPVAPFAIIPEAEPISAIPDPELPPLPEAGLPLPEPEPAAAPVPHEEPPPPAPAVPEVWAEDPVPPPPEPVHEPLPPPEPRPPFWQRADTEEAPVPAWPVPPPAPAPALEPAWDTTAFDRVPPPEPAATQPALPLRSVPVPPLPAQDLAPPPAPPANDLLWPANTRLHPAPYVPPPEADDDSLWAMDTHGNELEPAGPPATARPARRRTLLAGVAGVAAVAAIAAGLWLFGPLVFGGGRSVAAVFNAPMMVIRTAAPGRVVRVLANAGQTVSADTSLLTIRTDPGPNGEKPVLAGVRGMVRSVETVPGSDLATGAPLVRLQDCDRAFLTFAPSSPLRAGQNVQVKLGNMPVMSGTVRASSGIMEPPDALVVGLPPGSVTGTCPVGAAATVTPSVQG